MGWFFVCINFKHIKGQDQIFIELYQNFIYDEIPSQTFLRNEYLCKVGEVEKYLYFIKEGAVRAYFITEDDEFSIRFGYPNSVINSIISFVSGKPSELYIQALRKTEVLKISKANYFDFIYGHPDHMRMHIEVIHNLIESMMDREIDLLTYSPEERYKRVLERSPALFQHVPLKYIASYLRMTPETLSRLRKS